MPPAWFPSLPDARAPGFALLTELLDLLDRLAPCQLDSGSSEVVWTKTRQLNLLDVALRHRVEPQLNFALTLTDVNANLYYPHRTPEYFSEDTGEWPTELLAEVEQQLRQSYTIEQTYWRSKRLSTVLHTPDWTSVSGVFSSLPAVVPRRLLRVEVRTADYGLSN